VGCAQPGGYQYLTLTISEKRETPRFLAVPFKCPTTLKTIFVAFKINLRLSVQSTDQQPKGIGHYKKHYRNLKIQHV